MPDAEVPRTDLPSTDGRVARGERTREAIVEAHAELLREGTLRPTGKIIAKRAGISLRTLWLNFNDLEALLQATTAYWMMSDEALRCVVDPALPLEQRIEAYCAQRAARLENIAPAVRSALLGEPFSAALQASHAQHVQRSLDDLAEAFGPELMAPGTERDALLKGLFLATSWSSWISLRDDFDLDAAGAADVMRRTVTSLLHR
jgi:TetR/AcrR family transcriptional regulator of autoinduction and epiphytic fitness